MNKKKEQVVIIVFKTLAEDGTNEQMSITELKPHSAKRVYKKLLYRWKHYKVVDVPLFAIAVAADTIDHIALYK